jgi:hypothetical protein
MLGLEFFGIAFATLVFLDIVYPAEPLPPPEEIIVEEIQE